MHDEQATPWEASYFKLRRNRRRRRARLRWFDLPIGGRLLDYGCGDGLNLNILRAEGFGGGPGQTERLFGLDVSRQLLSHASGAAFVEADGLATPFADHSFDAVLVDNVLHHVDLERSVAELRRILRPGGRLCLLEPGGGLARRLLDRVTFSPVAGMVPMLAYRREHIAEEWETYSWWSKIEKNLPSILEQRGFTVLRVRREPLTLYVEALLERENCNLPTARPLTQ